MYVRCEWPLCTSLERAAPAQIITDTTHQGVAGNLCVNIGPVTTPAGWYDDGQGSTRWWDGQQWTEHVVQQEPAMPPSPAAAALPDTQTTNGKTSRGKLIGDAAIAAILRYDDQAGIYEVYSPFKNGGRKMVLKRVPDRVAYENLTEYVTFVQTSTKTKSGLGRAAGMGIVFGGFGAVVGAVTGRREIEFIDKIGVVLRTRSGDTYVLHILSTTTKASSLVAKAALGRLNDVVLKLESTGASESASLGRGLKLS